MPFWKKNRRYCDGTLDNIVKVRGRSTRELADSKFVNYPPGARRTWTPRSMQKQMTGLQGTGFSYTGGSRGDFYRWIRDNIPIVGTGVWAWVRLTATTLRQEIEGSSADRKHAEQVLAELDRRILETPYGRGSGLTKLTEACFLEMFTTGRFTGETILSSNGDSIDHFKFIDPYRVEWYCRNNVWTPYIRDDDDQIIKIDPERFFYGTLGTDLANPGGIEPLKCIPFVVEIEQMMLEDMSRSSHNAGTRRLQIKIKRPEQNSWEGDREYVDRANRYFQDIVREFQNLEPDDNVFTWSDVEVAVVGYGGSYAWRLNREQVIEDVITGLKLFPWVLGRTHGTTQNWVRTQYDLLMEMVQSYQKSGADLIDWLCNMELKLRGINARVRHRFDNHPDPFRLERVRAERIALENIDLKVQRAYISKDQGAQEMGYPKAYKQDEEDERQLSDIQFKPLESVPDGQSTDLLHQT